MTNYVQVDLHGGLFSVTIAEKSVELAQLVLDVDVDAGFACLVAKIAHLERYHNCAFSIICIRFIQSKCVSTGRGWLPHSPSLRK